MPRTGKSIDTESKLMVARGWGGGGEVTVKEFMVYSWVMKVFWN